MNSDNNGAGLDRHRERRHDAAVVVSSIEDRGRIPDVSHIRDVQRHQQADTQCRQFTRIRATRSPHCDADAWFSEDRPLCRPTVVEHNHGRWTFRRPGRRQRERNRRCQRSTPRDFPFQEISDRRRCIVRNPDRPRHGFCLTCRPRCDAARVSAPDFACRAAGTFTDAADRSVVYSSTFTPFDDPPAACPSARASRFVISRNSADFNSFAMPA